MEGGHKQDASDHEDKRRGEGAACMGSDKLEIHQIKIRLGRAAGQEGENPRTYR